MRGLGRTTRVGNSETKAGNSINKHYKHANILLSGVDIGHVTVKVEDLVLGMQIRLCKIMAFAIRFIFVQRTPL